MRFAIDRGLWSWLLSAFGATAERSYAEVGPDTLEVRFGFFRQTFRYDQLRAASVGWREVPWYRTGIGWRTDLAGSVGLIGAARNIVKLELARPRWVFMGLPVWCRDLFVSMEDPDAFVAMVRRRLGR